jgi:hypothetical protein
MKYLDTTSLSQTIDNVSEALLFDLPVDHDEKVKIVNFIADQQGKPNSYADTFAPTNADLKMDLVLFTGEKIKSRVGKCHMIGEEACRIIHKLDLKLENANKALMRAETGLQNQIDKVLQNPRYEYGMYCCRSCSCALWLNLTSGSLNNNTQMLTAGMEYLKKHRDYKGKWTGFPYYYTLFILNETQKDIAKEELIYTAGTVERRLKKRRTEENKYEMRRNYICEQILNKVNSN